MKVGTNVQLNCAAALVVILFASVPRVALAESAISPDSGQVKLMADSTNPVVLPGIVVTSDRTPLPLISITGAAYIVPFKESQQSVRPTISTVIGSIPGVRAVSTGNPWGQANLDVRGFYGAGLSQYLRTTYCGIPLNDIASGLVDLSDYSMLETDRLEAVNGPGSSQFGDFGFGGTLALQPAKYLGDGFNRYSLTVGSSNGVNGGLRFGGKVASWNIQAIESFKSHDGWRDHSALRTQRVALTFGRSDQDGSGVEGILSYGHTREEQPGALTQQQLESDRTASGATLMGNSLEDVRERDKLLAGVTTSIRLSPKLTLKPVVYGKYEESQDIVTVTKALAHHAEQFSGGVEITATIDDTLFGQPLKLVAGVSGEYGDLSTTYGIPASVDETSGAITNGDGIRQVLAAYATGLVYLLPKLYVVPGIRVDHVKNRFEYNDALVTRSGDVTEQSETVASPKLAVGADVASNVTLYASVAKAFKSPTLSLLYDSPPVYYPFPPVFGYITLSNRTLESMRGTNYEAGIRFADRKSLYVSLNLFWYQIKNEIEFDPATFQYKNLGRSRHRGMELAVSAAPFDQLRADCAVSYNDAVSDSGEFKGNQVNGVPLFSYDFGLTYSLSRCWQILGRLNGIGTQYLTLESYETSGTEQKELGDYVTVSLGANLTVSNVSVSLGVQNVLDKMYNVDGYFDPLSGQYLYYPAPGRTVTMTIGRTF